MPEQRIVEEDSVARLMRTLQDPLYSYVGRLKGRAAYKIWKERLLKIEEGQALWLNFPAGQVVDPSFAEESIIRLGREIYEKEFGERCLRLHGLTADSIININAIIKWRDHRVVFIAGHPQKGWQIIGRPPGKELSEIFEIVKAQNHTTSSELAAAHQIAVNAASTQLHRLYSLRLLRRRKELSERGIEYVYSVWL